VSEHDSPAADVMAVTDLSEDGYEHLMVTLPIAGRTVWCDPAIADLVTALNTGDLSTLASCSGHGYQPGSVALADGRCLMVFPDHDAWLAAQDALLALYPLTIHGEAVVQRPTQSASKASEPTDPARDDARRPSDG
jgi:hypothetical protein